jgi:hypothetical protein
MALNRNNINTSYLKPDDVRKDITLKVLKVEKVSKLNAFNGKYFEQYELLLAGNKLLSITEANLSRLLWNYGAIDNALGKEITLYPTQITVKDKTLAAIRIKYNILDKIKKESTTKLGEN